MSLINSSNPVNRVTFDPKIFQLSVLFPESKKSFSNATAEKRKGSTCPYLLTVIYLASAVGFVPFRINCNPSTGYYYISQVNLIRKIWTVMIHTFGVATFIIYNITTIIAVSSPEEFSTQFTRTFDHVTNLSSTLLCTRIIYIFWRGQKDILKIVEATRVNYGEKWNKIHNCLATGIFAITYIGCIYTHRKYSDSTSSSQSAPELPFEGESNLSSVNEALLSIAKIFLSIYYYHSAAFQYLPYVTLVALSLSMRGLKAEFCSSLMETLTTRDLKRGFDKYMDLKHLSNDVTRVFGSSILIFYIVTVAYFAKIPEGSVWSQSGQTAGMILFFSLGNIIWLVSAEFHMKVREVVQNWATQMQDLDDLDIDMRIKLMSVVNDNLLDPIGISCKFFTITYGFLGSMLGLIVTYAIIVFQMQTKPIQQAKLEDTIIEFISTNGTTTIPSIFNQ